MFLYVFYFPIFSPIFIVGWLTNMFGMGSNHQPESVLQTRVFFSPYSIPIYRAIISLQTSTDEAPSGFVHDALATKARVTVRVFLKEWILQDLQASEMVLVFEATPLIIDWGFPLSACRWQVIPLGFKLPHPMQPIEPMQMPLEGADTVGCITLALSFSAEWSPKMS